MTEIPIRPIALADPAAQACLAAYYAELSERFGEEFQPGPEPDPAAYAPPLGVFLLAGEGLGCVGLKGDGPGSAEVKRLWISPAARGRGLSRRLMQAVEAAAKEMGIARLRLDTSRHLPEALALYQRDGWAEIPRYNDNPHADFFFEKRL